jgi:hypothetical protein
MGTVSAKELKKICIEWLYIEYSPECEIISVKNSSLQHQFTKHILKTSDFVSVIEAVPFHFLKLLLNGGHRI